MVDPLRPSAPESSRETPSEPFDPGRTRTVFSLSEEETAELGASIGRGLKGGELILLDGDLGLGKTVLARGISIGIGVAPEDVSSPSYILVQEYIGGRVPLFHVDLYRLDSPEETESLGLDEILSAGGVVIVEWGSKLPGFYRNDALSIQFHDIGEGSRRIELLAPKQTLTDRRGDA
jgi:tRNA threonylcarbamoyladenosine biosynthesis protein TsaE